VAGCGDTGAAGGSVAGGCVAATAGSVAVVGGSVAVVVGIGTALPQAASTTPARINTPRAIRNFFTDIVLHSPFMGVRQVILYRFMDIKS